MGVPDLSLPPTFTSQTLTARLSLIAQRIQRLNGRGELDQTFEGTSPGLVPEPGLADLKAGRYLRADGTWADLSQFRARAYRSVGQSIPNTTLTTLAFDAENYDVGGFHAGGTFTIPAAGLYAIFGQVEHGASAGGTIRTLNAFVNGIAVAAHKLAATFNAGTLIGLHCYTEWVCAAGDAVTFQVYQDSGGALITGGAGGSGTFGGVRLIQLGG